MAELLIVDDDEQVLKLMERITTRLGYSVLTRSSLAAARETLRDRVSDVVFLDVFLPDGNGLDLLPEIRSMASPPEVVIMTGFGDPDGAELAIASGAWDYLQKPVQPKHIHLLLDRVFQYRENRERARKPPVTLKLNGIKGNSESFKACLGKVAAVAMSNVSVLVTGESGTGKELICRAIHYSSTRSAGNLVVVDCAALPESLAESILFGYEKGAYTGADRSKDGLVKQAHRGSLFLDEVGELPLQIQKSLLRVLQERRFRPIGGREEIESDFRLLAATNRDLSVLVQEKRFREDLLFRLSAFNIELPPLRMRQGDISELAIYHLGRLCERYGTDTKTLSPDFIDTLNAWNWPGNVRELVNTLEKAFIVAYYEPMLFSKHLPLEFRTRVVRESLNMQEREPYSPTLPAFIQSDPLPRFRDFRREVLARLEREYLDALLVRAEGSIEDACTQSGLGRTRLYGLLKKHGISRRAGSS